MNTPTRRAAIAAAAVAALALTGCTHSSPSNSAQSTGQAQTEQAYSRQQTAVPYPTSQLRDSLERRNVRERLLRYNNPNKLSYIYLLSQTGQVITSYTVKGKVTSNSSQMTTTDLIETKCHTSNGCNDVTVPAPGDDGSYGPNEDGIFFFTTEDVMITWNGPYLMSDAPQDVKTPPVIVYDKSSKPSSTGGR